MFTGYATVKLGRPSVRLLRTVACDAGAKKGTARALCSLSLGCLTAASTS